MWESLERTSDIFLFIDSYVSLCRGRRHLWIWNCWRGTVARKCVTVTLFCLSLTKGREYRRISTAEWMCIHSGKYLKQSTGGTVFSWPLSSTSKTLNYTWMSCCLSRNGSKNMEQFKLSPQKWVLVVKISTSIYVWYHLNHNVDKD